MRGAHRNPILPFLCLVVATACGSEELTGPEPPAGALQFRSVTAGYFHSCGLTTTGRAWCWGTNTFGMLGDGSLTSSTLPVPVAGGYRFESIESGAGHTCGVTASGQIYCWGLNDEGQAGLDWADRAVEEPHRLPGSQFWVQVSAGHDHSCGLTSDGDVWCWGDNLTGQLGAEASIARSFQPVRVGSAVPFTRVLAGYYQSCALTSAGRAWCWGRNVEGQVGDGSSENRLTPVEVQGGHSFRALAGGDAFVCGLATDGSVWCWGSNRDGELGEPTSSNQSIPVRVRGLPTLSRLFAAGGAFTIPSARAYACGLTARGEAWCWGGAIRGGLWEGPTEGPIRLERDIPFRDLALGAEHVCGVTTDNWAFCGGANYAGQLGDGSTVDRSGMVGVRGP